jgi:membrane-associated protein
LWVFAAVMAGSLAGAMTVFYAGAALQRRRERRSVARGAGGTGAENQRRLDRVLAGFARHGPIYLVVNRFLPGFRALFFVAAGMTRMPARQVLLYGGLSAALWNLLILAIGSLVGANLDALTAGLTRYALVVWIATGILVVGLVGRALWRRRAGPRS